MRQGAPRCVTVYSTVPSRPPAPVTPIAIATHHINTLRTDKKAGLSMDTIYYATRSHQLLQIVKKIVRDKNEMI